MAGLGSEFPIIINSIFINEVPDGSWDSALVWVAFECQRSNYLIGEVVCYELSAEIKIIELLELELSGTKAGAD